MQAYNEIVILISTYQNIEINLYGNMCASPWMHYIERASGGSNNGYNFQAVKSIKEISSYLQQL